MPKYKFIYKVSNGIFQIDVFTGMYILSDSHSQAMESASRLDEIIRSNYDFEVKFELIPQPQIAIICTRLSDNQSTKPKVLNFKIQKNTKSLPELPVFSEKDFKEVCEDEFLMEIQKTYSQHPKCKNVTALSFEIDSYGVQEVNSLH
jgi:hypothetical protein